MAQSPPLFDDGIDPPLNFLPIFITQCHTEESEIQSSVTVTTPILFSSIEESFNNIPQNLEQPNKQKYKRGICLSPSLFSDEDSSSDCDENLLDELHNTEEYDLILAWQPRRLSSSLLNSAFWTQIEDEDTTSIEMHSSSMPSLGTSPTNYNEAMFT
jgi:hypothetical protein